MKGYAYSILVYKLFLQSYHAGIYLDIRQSGTID